MSLNGIVEIFFIFYLPSCLTKDQITVLLGLPSPIITPAKQKNRKKMREENRRRKREKKATLALLFLILATLENEKADAWLKSILAR